MLPDAATLAGQRVVRTLMEPVEHTQMVHMHELAAAPASWNLGAVVASLPTATRPFRQAHRTLVDRSFRCHHDRTQEPPLQPFVVLSLDHHQRWSQVLISVLLGRVCHCHFGRSAQTSDLVRRVTACSLSSAFYLFSFFVSLRMVESWSVPLSVPLVGSSISMPLVSCS